MHLSIKKLYKEVVRAIKLKEFASIRQVRKIIYSKNEKFASSTCAGDAKSLGGVDHFYDVFLCHNSRDCKQTERVYNFLIENDKSVFFSDISLQKLSSCDYMKEIDQALEKSSNMIVVAADVNNLNSSYVEAEWRLFINEKRSGRKQGNIVTLIDGKLKIEDLPMSLRYYQVIELTKEGLYKLLNYI